MTNGEMIQKDFNCEVCEPIPEDDIIHVIFSDKNDSAIGFDWSWWNAEYKEPTTKNDLGVDTDKLIADCEKMSFDFELFGRHTKALLLDAVKNIVKELPSVTPQEPRWIPVSERLPEPYMFVNATCRSLVDDRENWVVETIYLPIPKEHNSRHYSDWGNIPMLNWGEAEVIAWVERIIPQPYKAESEVGDGECK